MFQKLRKENEGFTIIEVLIVLAIAGLILLIVFLAVPALQRNNRNTQRSNDAARVAGAINECLPNNNGNLSVCSPGSTTLDSYIDFTENQQLVASTGAGLDSFAFNSGHRCENNTPQPGGGSRSFTISYQVETARSSGGKGGSGNVTRCIQG